MEIPIPISSSLTFVYVYSCGAIIMTLYRIAQSSLQKSLSPKTAENWEYAFNFDAKFHPEEKKVDMVRRRRWHRVIVPSSKGDETGSLVIQLGDKGSSVCWLNLLHHYTEHKCETFHKPRL